MAGFTKWEEEVSKRYLRVRKDGFIYEWNEILAANPECEEVSEDEVFPTEVPKVKRGRKTKVALDLSTADIPEPPPYTSPELSQEAARKWPK